MSDSTFCSTATSTFGGVSVPDFGYSNRRIVVSHYVLIFISLMTHGVEHLFICLFAICTSSLVRCLLMSLARFSLIIDLLSCHWILSSLYILKNSPLSDVSFANIFSQSVACLLILLILSFSDNRFLILMKSSLSPLCIYFSMDCAFGFVSTHFHTLGHLNFFVCYCLEVYSFVLPLSL